MRLIRLTFVNFSDAGPAIPTQGWRANTSTKCRRTKVNTTLFLLLSTARFRYGGEFLSSCAPHFVVAPESVEQHNGQKYQHDYQHNAQRQLTGSTVPQRQVEIGLTLDGMTKGNSVMPAVKITPNCINDAIKIPNPGDHDKSPSPSAMGRRTPAAGRSTERAIRRNYSSRHQVALPPVSLTDWKDR